MRGVPVVARGEMCIYAQDLAAVGGLAGIDYDGPARLPAGTLVRKYLRVIEASLAFAAKIPVDRLQDKLPGRDRSYLELANHIVEIAAGFIRVSEGEAFEGRVADATPEPTMALNALKIYADTVTGDLRAWANTRDTSADARAVDTYYGPQTLHAVLERCTWHSAQHARQLMMVLALLGIAPEDPLTTDDLAGLPLPAEGWDS